MPNTFPQSWNDLLHILKIIFPRRPERHSPPIIRLSHSIPTARTAVVLEHSDAVGRFLIMVALLHSAGAMPPPLTPIQRPLIGMKRDSSYLDTDDEGGLSTATKKLRVAFSDEVKVRIMDDWNAKSFELVKEEVRLAIQRHLGLSIKQDDVPYSRLLTLFSHDVLSSEALSTAMAKKYIMALSGQMSSLGDCRKLVMAILDLSWVGRSKEFVETYVRFLVVLASTHAKYLPSIMERLVAHFEKLPASTGRLPDETPVSRQVMFDRLHSAMHSLLERIPSASGHLMTTFDLSFPKELATARAYLQYQKQLLRVAAEVPELSSEILALIMQKVVNIDVQIQREIEDIEEDDHEEKLLGRPRERRKQDHPEDSDESDDESESESEISITPEEERLQDLRAKVAKMDGAQDLLFEHYAPAFKAETSPDDNIAYQQLISHFSGFIMANRCRHAQFLVFHFAQTSPVYADDFAKFCLRMTVSNAVATNVRLTACAYLASFIARGAHIPTPLVRDVFGVLCHYLEEMRRRYEPTCAGPDRRSYHVYYAVAQALFYVFCFRWRDLVISDLTSSSSDGCVLHEEDQLAEGGDLVWLQGIQGIIDRSVKSQLNPLKVCSAVIVEEFSKIANYLRFIYVITIIERNKRIRLGQSAPRYRLGAIDLGRRETAWDRKKGDVHHQLEAYFPFDPYHLPKSKRWLEGEYNEWELPRGMEHDDQDGDVSENDDDDDIAQSDDEYDSSDADSLPDNNLALEHAGDVDLISVSS